MLTARVTRATACSGSISAPMTTSPSRFRCASSRAGSGRCCGDGASTAGCPRTSTGTLGSTVSRGAMEVELDGEPVRLTMREFELLWYLVMTRPRVASRESILERVWGLSSDVETRTVDVHVRALRKKLGLRVRRDGHRRRLSVSRLPMKRRRHLLTAFLAGLPLLVLVLVGPGTGVVCDSGSGGAAVGWCGARSRDGDLADAGGAGARDHARPRCRHGATRRHGRSRSCGPTPHGARRSEPETTSLLEDLTSSLGDGLLVVSSDLEIRLINRVARRFCGVETVGSAPTFSRSCATRVRSRAVETAAAGDAPDAGGHREPPRSVGGPRLSGSRRRGGGAAHRCRAGSPRRRTSAALRPGPLARTAVAV